jgi:O-antigen/teichoic acid export membrane protein
LVFRIHDDEVFLMPPAYDGTASSGVAEGRQRGIRNWLRHTAGIDKPIAFTILARGWASFAGLITVALIARFLSPAEQGYYYTFGSLVALQIVFELGFSFVILQMASHERAHLTIGPKGAIEGSEVAHARLASVLQKSVRWYSAAALLLVVALILAGGHFFAAHQLAGAVVHWGPAWYATAVAAAITFQIDPVLSFMEGCGFVANVARVRFAQAVTGSLLAWTALATHHGLFAPAMVISGNAVVALVWLASHGRMLIELLRHDPAAHRVHWFREVWHFQWRIAVSWLCGYFIYQLFNPVLFAYRGPVAAGQMGMSLSLANALQSVAIAWLNTKAAPFGSMIARREFGQLDRIFFRSLKQSIAVYALGAVCIVAGAVALSAEHVRFSQRLLSPALLGVLLLSTMANVIVFGEALYLRAHKQEKFLLNSVLGAVLVSACTVILGKYYGAAGMVVGCLGTGLFMGLPLGTYTFIKYRRLWHVAC